MRPHTLIAGALVLAGTINVIAIARADIRITADHGGAYSEHVAKLEQARASGERVVIDGPCESGCTLYLNLPANQVCATARGSFGFHAAVDGQLGLPHPATTQKVWDAYPPKVRIWLGQRGGLWLDVKTVSARQFVRACN